MILLDLTEWNESLLNVFENADVVFHFAAISSERCSWDQAMSSAQMAFNVMQACHIHGVERVVYSSSNHAVGGYWDDDQVGAGGLTTDLPGNPGICVIVFVEVFRNEVSSI